MVRLSLALALAAALNVAPAVAQEVEVQPLAAPDSFSIPARETGLSASLWRGTAVETLRTVLPLIAGKPLSPAAQALARRVLATGAPGPEGSADPALLGARAQALLALGDVKAAAAVLERASGLERNAELSRAAAETALLTGQDARACALAEGLAVGREDIYWLRLRAFCQAAAGQTAQAQLTFDLAQAQARDAVFGRLMSARLSGAAPGAPSLRNGLDYALSRALELDVTGTTPSPAVAAAFSDAPPAEPVFEIAAAGPAVAGLAGTLATGDALSDDGVSALIAAAAEADAKSRPRLQSQAVLIAALKPELTPADRRRLAGFAVAEGKAPAGRSLALADAAQRGLAGETALLALWTAAESGAAGPAVADRARIARALAAAGLMADARAFVLEGLAGLK
ncbi:hypothetical protein [Phenylobacterium sp.]|jgi:hypothetical protein|uniref:hypothetical protein n=1 Tax=Phenylobacterium sp. TaxID=1871053 RepID=UPI0037830B52